MKTIIVFFFALGLLLASLFVSGQSKSDKIYDAFANEEGISSFTVSKNRMDAFAFDMDGERNITGDIDEIRFMSYNPEEGAFTGRSFIAKSISMLPARYREYRDENDELSNTRIWLLGKKKRYTECHIFVANDNPEGNCFLVSFYGTFRVDDLLKLEETGHELLR